MCLISYKQLILLRFYKLKRRLRKKREAKVRVIRIYPEIFLYAPNPVKHGVFMGVKPLAGLLK